MTVDPTTSTDGAARPWRGLHPAERVADYRARGWWSEETVDGLLDEHLATRPDRLALVDPANKAALTGAAPRRLTWAELASEVDHLAAELIGLGLRSGDVLGVQLPNTVELVEVYLAAWHLGLVVSPLAMQYREHEVAGMAQQAGFAALVTCSRFGDRAPLAEALVVRAGRPELRTVVAYGSPDELADAGAGDDVVVVFAQPATPDERALVAQRRRADPPEPNDAVTICWTSGTEAEPKGVPRTSLEWLVTTWACIDAPRMDGDDVLLNPFPMVNMAGIAGMFLPWLRTGCVLVQHQPFDLPTFLGQVAAERVTYTVAPPALLWMLLNNEALLSQVDLGSLTRIGSGSVPLQPPMVRGWQEQHGIGVINFFGSNEGIALLSSPEDFPDPDDRATYFPRYGAPGSTWTSRVSEWVSLRLTDLTTGEDITEPGVPGELRLAGPTVFAGYLGGDHLPSPFDDRGYLRTGDVFEIAGDRNQYLRFVDRAKDVVIRGGMNVAPAELEALISAHPAVAEVAVVGDPDEVLGERVAAIVTLRPDASLDLPELVEFLRAQKIASFKLPERLEVRESLPRNPVGKILKRDLRAAPATDSR